MSQRTYTPQEAKKAFWEKIKEVAGCWEWQGARNSQGYGACTLTGKNTRAHRQAFMYTIGPIPSGMLVCHTCDNPPCVNPEHLFLGTHKDNVRDMRKKHRTPPHIDETRTHCMRGHEFTSENTGRQATGRYCKKCKLTRDNSKRKAIHGT